MRSPVVERLSVVPDAAATAEQFADLPFLLLLDSTADPERTGRYSFLTADPYAVIRSRGAKAEWLYRGGEWEPLATDALSAVRAALAPLATDPVPGLPPFQGGAAGYIGYDWGATLERLPPSRYDDLALPDLVLGLYDWVLAWDHCEQAAWIIAAGIAAGGADREASARARLEAVRARLAARPPRLGPREAGGVRPGPAAPSYPVLGVEGAEEIGLRSTFTHRGYLSAVARVREYVLAGDIFQANLSQRFQAAAAEPPLALYQRLRRINPAAFGAYLHFDDLHVLSVSPERFLKLSGRSDKDRAENVMIVDLLRNDLSRVCRPGTVRVPELLALEQHPTVHHLVSTVVGELESGRDAVDLLRATFPGGSITGAPKVRAMEIIAELEPTRRGIYCGSLGYLGAGGTMDTSIAIRTAVVRDGEVYFQAGGGIVADSDPEAEYRETLDKARGIIRALAT